jgi:hypothetical protein
MKCPAHAGDADQARGNLDFRSARLRAHPAKGIARVLPIRGGRATQRKVTALAGSYTLIWLPPCALSPPIGSPSPCSP